ncbi:hypothetical protein MHLP_03825 [Candidatus Mycoplasma haematolamae str. Purdue]|uniref:Uncharacterized protein n=1 Tax=Mycoplasma haematolamae (strain Purdue) TaxID=1212765 RepID=I7BAK4_MYCHA|nr:hypothetical protein [Candidatus Mycoplasma haematolamae]AFO52345.1 hypothetical protein MHLP_03825 [Candidatus Mycoplasma haematolamae str. Purdue]
MSLTSLWLKGLSQQGKIYLATSSMAIGSATTGVLAVDSTRDSIWTGVSYVGSSVASALSYLLTVKGAEAGGGIEHDDTVTNLFSTAWDGLSLLVSSGSKWAWRSTIYTIDWLRGVPNKFESYSGYVKSFWTYLTTNYKTLWIFLKHSFPELDLQKIYNALFNSSTRQSTAKIFSDESQNGFKNLMKSMESIATKSYEIGFDVSGAFRKLMTTFLDSPSSIPKFGSRLSILKNYISTLNNGNQEQAKSILEFFSQESDQDITNLKWNRFPSSR